MSSAAVEQTMLRFLTAGSVDDGKSTLIGRLLYDSDGIFEDQISSVRKASALKHVELDLSLPTDGLKAEREQGITIDVAYRYFSTPRRKFIIADTPGHEQYTRNMATGASTAHAALILIDARKGVLRQARRHALVAWLLGIRQIIVAINKMDLVAFDQQVFCSICDDFNSFAKSLNGVHLHFIPLSALLGNNITRSSDRMSWYQGPCLLGLLETLPAEPARHEAMRFPIQGIVRPDQDFRGYTGQVVSGTVIPGQEVVALPSGQSTKVREIHFHTRTLDQAGPFRSVILTTTDHIDLGRGDMLAAPDHMPIISTNVSAQIVWMSHTPLRNETRYLVKHTTRLLCGEVTRLNHKIDIDTLDKLDTDTLQMNEIGEVQIHLHDPIFCDPYKQNRSTGSFILIDPFSNDTVAAGMILEAAPSQAGGGWDQPMSGSRIARQQGLTVWFTGLSASGKTTICRAVATELLAHGLQVEVLDGDVIRKHLCKDLGFSKRDRDENIRRIAFLSHLLTRNGTVVLVAAISPYRAAREEARRTIGDFTEVYVSAPLSLCELRDPKELYKKARSGRIQGFTGVDDPYEPPLMPEVVCATDRESTTESSNKVVRAVLDYLSLFSSSPSP